MRPTQNQLSISAVRTDALFVSVLQPSEEPDARQVRRAVAVTVGLFGTRGCAGQVAHEFGEHPEIAAARMRWARRVVAEAFAWPGWHRTPQRRPAQHAAGRAA
jgi:hypothetical protein